MKASGLPEGVFSLLFDAGVEVGVRLVQHPAIKAVGFTGSFAGGTALMKLCAARPEPIPCYAEMGSVNPIFVLPGALNKRASAVATGLQASFTVGAGQMCTKPGLVLVPQEDGTPAFMKELGERVQGTPSQTLLTKAIADRFTSAVKGRMADAKVLAEGAKAEGEGATVQASLFVADYQDLQKHEELAQEIFGPTTVVVGYQDRKQLLAVAEQLEGHLTATLHADEGELADYADLIEVLTRKVGRLILNGYPTGVEVLARHGARGSISRHQRWTFHFGGYAGHLPLHPAGVLSILSRCCAAGRVEGQQSAGDHAPGQWGKNPRRNLE